MNVIPGIIAIVFKDRTVADQLGKEVAGCLNGLPSCLGLGYSVTVLALMDFRQNGIEHRFGEEQAGEVDGQLSHRLGGTFLIDALLLRDLGLELGATEEANEIAHTPSALLGEVAGDILALEDEIDRDATVNQFDESFDTRLVEFSIAQPHLHIGHGGDMREGAPDIDRCEVHGHGCRKNDVGIDADEHLSAVIEEVLGLFSGTDAVEIVLHN